MTDLSIILFLPGLDAMSLLRYDSGILPYCMSNNLNHAVLLVGYGTGKFKYFSGIFFSISQYSGTMKKKKS